MEFWYNSHRAGNWNSPLCQISSYEGRLVSDYTLGYTSILLPAQATQAPDVTSQLCHLTVFCHFITEIRVFNKN